MGKRPKEIIDNLRTGRLGSPFRLISKVKRKHKKTSAMMVEASF
ncbi:hypothetical protein [Bacillus mojavensis]|nr:hypothetical protein [Bacillus mojavensis]MEC1704674.1 hypothetical protein [Bacillus mojavensis]MEC5246171.1 hypothetical protein [Bacillus mojavensis]